MKRIVLALAVLANLAFTTPVTTPPSPDVHGAIGRAADATEQKVVFNTKTLKYHCPTCTWAKRCTRNCITTTLADAILKGGVACKVCGGTCSRRSNAYSDEMV